MKWTTWVISNSWVGELFGQVNLIIKFGVSNQLHEAFVAIKII